MDNVEQQPVGQQGQERERRIVLASRSPRRRWLLEQLGFHPVVWPAEVPEGWQPGESPADYTRRLSEVKAEAVAVQARDWLRSGISPWVLAADTVVVLDGSVLEKPEGEQDARRMLRLLQGRWHTVFTAFCLYAIERASLRQTRVVKADVLIKELGDREIDRYIASRDPMDKAGAYGIQGLGSFLVREVRGSYFAVVGLPVCEVVETLLAVGALSAFPFLPGEAGR
ncbi:MAG: septum formation protein Maf [Bradymonadales bacterium]|nr:septum formation protein Maf [Bradymonadales bacterium]